MKKTMFVAGIFMFIIIVFIAFSFNPVKRIRSDKIIVVTTLFPLYDIAKNIGGDKAEVSLLLPPGVEAHSFDPKPSDIVKINEADIFVYTGRFEEPWAEDIIKGAINKNLIVVDASRGAKMIPAVFDDADESAGSFDPHIWLDFDNVKMMTAGILEAFIAKDGKNAAFYERTGADYLKKLEDLDFKYRQTLSTCAKKEIIYAGHYAFGYMASRYGFQHMAAQGVAPDSEPTANDLIALVNQIKKENIQYIFYEELTSSKIAETIAKETNAGMLLLNTAEKLTRDQLEQGVSFFDILNTDLDNLKIGLDC